MADEIRPSGGQPLAGQPIFILGVMPRSGTNFLFNLLCAHPECGGPGRVREDYLLCYAPVLLRYVERVYRHWNPRWGVDDALRDELCAHLGSGLGSFLAAQSAGKRAVTKTPRIDNLDRFFRLFPKASLLILMRDGRAVVESGIRTFRWPREAAVQKWAECARAIVAFDQANRDGDFKYLIVRYEDLCTDLERELRRIFDFLGLDAEVYDFQAAARAPVLGSSTVRERGNETMHWKPVEKPSDFDPMSRWKHWGRRRHRRFNWVAGRYLAHFGYEPRYPASGGLVSAAWNVVLDGAWTVARTVWTLFSRNK